MSFLRYGNAIGSLGATQADVDAALAAYRATNTPAGRTAAYLAWEQARKALEAQQATATVAPAPASPPAASAALAPTPAPSGASPWWNVTPAQVQAAVTSAFAPAAQAAPAAATPAAPVTPVVPTATVQTGSAAVVVVVLVILGLIAWGGK